MTKLLQICAVAAACVCPVIGSAAIETSMYELKNVLIDGEETPVMLNWVYASDNGKYAVGCDVENAHVAFRFNVETKEFELLNEPSWDANEGMIMAKDVADDGTVAGAVVRPGILCDDPDAGERNVFVPALLTPDGEWEVLPLPENVVTKYDYRYSDYSNFAKLISPDGNVVVGEVFYKIGEKPNVLHPEKITSITVNYPIIWRKVNGEWTYEEFNLTLNESSMFIPAAMNDDASVIVGKIESLRGEHLPAVYKDGELYAIFGPKLVYNEEYGVYDEVDENGNVIDGYFWDAGNISWLDDDLNTYYIYIDSSESIHSGVLNLASGENTEISGLISCGTNGWWLGQKTVKAGTDVNISSFYSALSVSDDGTLIGGVGYSSFDGAEWNHPMVYLLSESPCATEGVNDIMTAPEDASAVYYDLQGRKVVNPGCGIYVKVSTLSDGTTRTTKEVIR